MNPPRRFNNPYPSAAPARSTGKLLTLASGGWIIALAAFFSAAAAAYILYPAFETGFQHATGDGRNPDTYGFDLSNLQIPRDQLIASGASKDSIRAIPASLVETITPPEVELMHKNEHLNFIVPTDRIIGLTIDGQTRAYPISVLNEHECINDVFAGVPIAVTWSPLCGSAVVFDRRIDGPGKPPVAFGVSGLLVNSNTVLYDQRPDPRKESLWPQLSFRAIAGPAVGKSLTLVPFTFTTWQAWTKVHPDAHVVEGLRRLKTTYTWNAFSTYLSTDALKFPVSPIWNHPAVALKTRIAVTRKDGRWTAEPEPLAAVPTTSPALGAITVHSFVFAWYAQHPDDTDYSALLK